MASLSTDFPAPPLEAVAAAAAGLCDPLAVAEVVVAPEGVGLTLRVPEVDQDDEALHARLAAALRPWAVALRASLPASWRELMLEFPPKGRRDGRDDGPPSDAAPDFGAVEGAVLPAMAVADLWPSRGEVLTLHVLPVSVLGRPMAGASVHPARSPDPLDLPGAVERALEATRDLASGTCAAWAPWFLGVRQATLTFRWPAPSALGRVAARRAAREGAAGRPSAGGSSRRRSARDGGQGREGDRG